MHIPSPQTAHVADGVLLDRRGGQQRHPSAYSKQQMTFHGGGSKSYWPSCFDVSKHLSIMASLGTTRCELRTKNSAVHMHVFCKPWQQSNSFGISSQILGLHMLLVACRVCYGGSLQAGRYWACVYMGARDNGTRWGSIVHRRRGLTSFLTNGVFPVYHSNRHDAHGICKLRLDANVGMLGRWRVVCY